MVVVDNAKEAYTAKMQAYFACERIRKYILSFSLDRKGPPNSSEVIALVHKGSTIQSQIERCVLGELFSNNDWVKVLIIIQGWDDMNIKINPDFIIISGYYSLINAGSIAPWVLTTE